MLVQMASPHIWRPLTQHALSPEPAWIESANDACLYDRQGNRWIDAVSSWWTVTHGHNHPVITKAIQDQAAQLHHVMAAGFTHEPAEEFTNNLHKFLAPHLRYCFFSDSGSTANEVALRMALGAWHHKKQDRTLILSFDKGYHGATLANTAIAGRGAFSTPYEKLLFDVLHMPTPVAGHEDHALETLKNILKEKGNQIAALMIEPLVLGAAGMVMIAPDVIKDIATLCRAHGITIIFDEVMTGFGRTGAMFAYEQTGVVPDILALGKGITGGALPMGLTVASQEIYDAFYAKDRSRMLFYSTSYGGNALAVAAANANLKIWQSDPVLKRIKTVHQMHEDLMRPLKGDDRVRNCRVQGTIAALDVVAGNQGYEAEIALKLQEFYFKNHLVLRPIGQVVYILPPYCISPDDLKIIYDTITASLSLIDR